MENVKAPLGIEMQGALDIEGLLFRNFQVASDYSQIAEVFSRSWEADGLKVYMSAQDAARLYSNTKNFNPHRDFLIAQTSRNAGGEIVGYGRSEWQDENLDDEGDGFGTKGRIRVYIFKLYIAPEWRGKGVEKWMVLYYGNHLKEIARSQDFEGARFIQTFVSDRYQEYVMALESEGYQAVRYEYDLVRPELENIPELPLPARLEARRVEPEHLRAIWEAEVEAFRDHWGFSEPEEADYQRWIDYPNFQPHLWQVAWDIEEDQVAGMIRNYISEEENSRYGRQRGYTEWISVRRPWRRRGLGRALLARSLKMHKELGMMEAALSVDSQNALGALQLYESMGFRVVLCAPTYRKPLAITE